MELVPDDLKDAQYFTGVRDLVDAYPGDRICIGIQNLGNGFLWRSSQYTRNGTPMLSVFDSNYDESRLRGGDNVSHREDILDELALPKFGVEIPPLSLEFDKVCLAGLDQCRKIFWFHFDTS